MYLHTTMLSRRTAQKLLEAEALGCPSNENMIYYDDMMIHHGRMWGPSLSHYTNHPVLIWNDATSLETSWVTVLIDVRKMHSMENMVDADSTWRIRQHLAMAAKQNWSSCPVARHMLSCRVDAWHHKDTWIDTCADQMIGRGEKWR